MEDIQNWMRSIHGSRPTTPSTEQPDDSSSFDSQPLLQAAPQNPGLERPRRPAAMRISSFLPTRRSLSNLKGPLAEEQEPPFSPRDNVYCPDIDQMADTLQRAVMVRVGKPLPPEFTSALLHVLEAYRDQKTAIKNLKAEVKKEKVKHVNNMEKMEVIRQHWVEEEQDYENEIERLRAIVALMEEQGFEIPTSMMGMNVKQADTPRHLSFANSGYTSEQRGFQHVVSGFDAAVRGKGPMGSARNYSGHRSSTSSPSLLQEPLAKSEPVLGAREQRRGFSFRYGDDTEPTDRPRLSFLEPDKKKSDAAPPSPASSTDLHMAQPVRGIMKGKETTSMPLSPGPQVQAARARMTKDILDGDMNRRDSSSSDVTVKRHSNTRRYAGKEGTDTVGETGDASVIAAAKALSSQAQDNKPSSGRKTSAQSVKESSIGRGSESSKDGAKQKGDRDEVPDKSNKGKVSKGKGHQGAHRTSSP
ncbi:MAG: hypothetical protein M1833_004468 [Piccolia ochrophora]|nr:MAG: hypothetical protein M1833_004468 [Piccolia ochrophora]